VRSSASIRIAWTCALALVLSGLLGAAGRQDPDRSVPEESAGKQTHEWIESVRPGQAVRVVNLFGNVHSRFGGYEGRVEILATSQRLESELPALEVRVADRGETLDVEVGFARSGTGPADTRDRVDLVVFVPQGAALDVRTRDGLIDAKKLKSDVIASSLDGDLRLQSIQGRVVAKTARGAITATLVTGATDESQQLTTETGDVEVWLWEDAAMTVDLATSGEISTDFSLKIEHRRFEEPSKHAVAVVGEGGPELSLRSKQGRLRLLRLQKHFRPES
jgi:hypothetical protein